jgi:hypothetical protein
MSPLDILLIYYYYEEAFNKLLFGASYQWRLAGA